MQKCINKLYNDDFLRIMTASGYTTDSSASSPLMSEPAASTSSIEVLILIYCTSNWYKVQTILLEHLPWSDDAITSTYNIKSSANDRKILHFLNKLTHFPYILNHSWQNFMPFVIKTMIITFATRWRTFGLSGERL